MPSSVDSPIQDSVATQLPYAAEYHTPIMVRQILDGLAVQKDGLYIDATAGGGGHTQAILEQGGRVVAIDQDQQALDYISQRLSQYIDQGKLQIRKGNFRQLAELLNDAPPAQGLLMDLGVSSHQLDQAERGFSFKSANLDMRMDSDMAVSAAQLLNTLPVSDLITLLRDYGQERYAKHFAQVIDSHRQRQPITSGQDLADMLYQASPRAYKYGPIHPATRTFQALRLAVNDELHSLEQALPQTVQLLAEGGCLAVISFHSLEDRLVKHFMSGHPQLQAQTKKPLQADSDEIQANPRSRSAKLRLAIKKS